MNRPDDKTTPKPGVPALPPRVPPFRGPLGGAPGPLAGRPGAVTPPRHPARPSGPRPVFATPPTSGPSIAASPGRTPTPPSVTLPSIDDYLAGGAAPSAPAASAGFATSAPAEPIAPAANPSEPTASSPSAGMAADSSATDSAAARSSYHDYAAFDPASWPEEPPATAGADVLASQAPTAPMPEDLPGLDTESGSPVAEGGDGGVPRTERARSELTTPRDTDVVGAEVTMPSATGWDPSWDADEETAEGTGAGFGTEPLESSIEPGPDLERWSAPSAFTREPTPRGYESPRAAASAGEEAGGSAREGVTRPRGGQADAALAEALERVAVRFRSGELSAPAGASASSDEAALALALSAILGQRR